MNPDQTGSRWATIRTNSSLTQAKDGTLGQFIDFLQKNFQTNLFGCECVLLNITKDNSPNTLQQQHTVNNYKMNQQSVKITAGLLACKWRTCAFLRNAQDSSPITLQTLKMSLITFNDNSIIESNQWHYW